MEQAILIKNQYCVIYLLSYKNATKHCMFQFKNFNSWRNQVYLTIFQNHV